LKETEGNQGSPCVDGLRKPLRHPAGGPAKSSTTSRTRIV